MPTGLPTSGTCPRPPGRQSAPPALPAPGQAPAGLWDALCWLARREGFAVEREARRASSTAPPSGPPAASGILPGLTAASRPSGRWRTSSATSCCTRDPAHAARDHHRPAARGCARPKPTRSPGSPAPVTASPSAASLPYPASWAGSDPRAQPAAALLAAGHRIATAATRVIRHTDRVLHGDGPAPVPAPRQEPVTPAASRAPTRQDDAASRQAAPPAERPAAPRPPGGPGPRTLAVLRRRRGLLHQPARRQLGARLPGSRGVSDVTSRDWDIGYAPAGWSALTGHLRGLGHDDRAIQAAGLAKPSSRGTLIDIFRDRIMLPVRDPGGTLAGFIGRAHPRASPDVPKYLNSPETAAVQERQPAVRAAPRPPGPRSGRHRRSLWKDRSTPSPSPSPTPAGTPGSPPAALP